MKGGCSCASVIVTTIEEGFYRWGKLIARQPWVGILLPILITAALVPGIVINFENETRGDKLWVPSGTLAQEHKQFVDVRYPSQARGEQYIVVAQDGTSNVLTPEALQIALDIHKNVTGIVSNYTNTDGEFVEGVQYVPEGDFCIRIAEGQCTVISLLLFFDFDPENFSTQQKILSMVNKVSPDTNPYGYSIDRVLSGIERNDQGDIVAATALPTNYLVRAEITVEAGTELDPRAEDWEQIYLDNFEELSVEIEESSDYTVVWFATRSFGDEFGGQIDGDLNILFAGIILIIVYSVIQLSDLKNGCVGLRLVSTIAGIICIVLAIGASFGLCSYLDLFYSPLASVLPFLLIGIGVDDMFIITGAFDQTANHEDEPDIVERVARSLAISGTSVTITSLTNFGALIIGSNTSLPALRNFSIYAAFGILFDYIFTVSLYPVALMWDAKRQNAKKLECCCCVTTQNTKCCCCNCDNQAFTRRALGGLAKQLIKKPVKFAVLALFVGILAGGIYGTVSIPVEADVDDFIPSDSYLQNLYDVFDEYVTNIGPAVDIYIRGVDYADPASWPQLDEVATAFANEEEFVQETQAWWVQFRAYFEQGGDNLSQNNFYDVLGEWLETEAGRPFLQNDLVFAEDGKTLETTRYTGQFKHLEGSNIQVDAMDKIREQISTTELGAQDKAFAYAADFLQYEQYKTIGREAIMNIGLGFAMIAVVIFLLLGNIVASLVTILCVISTVVELVGYMYFWDMTVDSIMVIFVVISLGLSVDYSTHVAHGYLMTSGEPDERVYRALYDTGASVFNGGFSTLLAIFLLGSSSSYVFVTFFKALLLTCVLGLFQGLVVLPVIMSFVNPATQGGDEGGKRGKAKEVELGSKAEAGAAPKQLDSPQA